MLALGIHYLRGVVVGSHGEHSRVEWPPHPARVFMAMVAAHYETGANGSEREALLWLEGLPEFPDIYASEAASRGVVTQYVPVNDDSSQFSRDPNTKKAKFFQEIPFTSLRRNRQERVFACASLESECVTLHWLHAEPNPAVRAALGLLCGKVTRIGHSTSLVQVWLADSIPSDVQRWTVDERRATHLFRVAKPGTLKELDRAFNGDATSRYCDLKVAEAEAAFVARSTARLHSAVKAAGGTAKAKKDAKLAADEAKNSAKATEEARIAEFPKGEPPRHRPQISTYAGYAKADEISENTQAAGSVFSPHLVVFTLGRKDGPLRQLDLACTLALTDRWREALASHANDLDPETQSLLTGHALDGAPLQNAHVAFLPLAFVGHQHADGRLPGVALALPTNTPAAMRAAVLRTAARVCKEGLKLGRLGAWEVDASIMARPLETLRAVTWTAHPKGAVQWSTVTPIAYDQHPKSKTKAEYLAEVAEMIANGCERIGLPRPREVIATPASTHLGSPPAHAFPRLRRKDGSERRHTHAILLFEEPVCGPIVIGAGRYRGYGLCRPMEIEP